VITPKGLNLGAGLVPGGRGRAAADGERSAAANRGHHSKDSTAARAAELSLEFVVSRADCEYECASTYCKHSLT
jgi:hypothetical protein